jgi:hypothetical protein
MHAYRMTGLNVSSEVALPGARPGSPTATPDVVIGRAEVPLHLDAAVIARRAWEAAEGRFLFRATGTGRFLLTGGRHIGFQPEAGISAADCAGHLMGAVFGLLLHQRGEIILHASAVLIGGNAILFCGRSGLGKSTLAAALCLRGHPLVADDICAISFDADAHPRVSTHSRQLKLAADAAAAFGFAGRDAPNAPQRLNKYQIDPPVEIDQTEFPVGGIYILRPYGQHGPEIQPTTSAEALRLLQRNAYRPGIVKHTGQTARYFEAAAMMARKVGVFRLAQARDLSRLPATADLIERREGEQAREQGREDESQRGARYSVQHAAPKEYPAQGRHTPATGQ